MSCDRMELLQHLVVEHSEALEEETWREHFEDCAGCRAEWGAFTQSLAIFKQLEAERLALLPAGPEWEEISATLKERSFLGVRVRALRVSFAAAGAAMVLGAASWFTWSGSAITPGETTENKARVERPAPRNNWYITPEQMNGVARDYRRQRLQGRVTQGISGETPVVFEITLEPPAHRSAGSFKIELKSLGGAGGTTAGARSLSLGAKTGPEQTWQPPRATPVSGPPGRRGLPATFKSSQ